MSPPISYILHPLEPLGPSLEPEVRSAIMAKWTGVDSHLPCNSPAMDSGRRRPPQ